MQCCHTYPNDKLLQQTVLAGQTVVFVVIPIQTISFYNLMSRVDLFTLKVVIPIQTISFYNSPPPRKTSMPTVVIPIQTISFYNSPTKCTWKWKRSCHTYPNDKLLQHLVTMWTDLEMSCHTYPNDKLLQRRPSSTTMPLVKLSYLSKR